MYPNASTKEYKVNEFLKLKLQNGRTNIYVKNRIFTQCMYLLLNIPVDRIREYDQINSIDEAAELLDRSMEGGGRNWHKITAEEEFQGHCSNIQAWYENDYDTRILHRNIAFPLLKRLTDAGDKLAKQRFKEEIALRYSSGHHTVMTYLLHNGYLKYLDKEELECLLDENQLPYLESLARDFDRTFRNINSNNLQYEGNEQTLAEIKKQRIHSRLNPLINRMKNYLGTRNIPFILSNVVKNASKENKTQLVNYIINKYKNNRNFPLIEFLNNNLEYFEGDLETVNYNNSIVGLINSLQPNHISLKEKNIKNIFEIQLPNDEYSDIRIINLSNNIIQKLDGIEKFSNLQVLKLNNNNIKQIEGLESLEKINEISLRNNKISTIHGIENLKNLKKIDFSGNYNIEEIPDFLAELPDLKLVKLHKCNLKRFSDEVSSFFWNDQNYRFYKVYTEEAVNYYESHYSNRKAHSNNQLYKHFAQWVIKLQELMEEFEFNIRDLVDFEEETERKSIWSGKPTLDFIKWLYNKPQTKLSDFW